MARPRGRPKNPLPPIYWRLRLDLEPPEVDIEGKVVPFRHAEIAKILQWQIVLVQPARDENEKAAVLSIPSSFEADDGTEYRWVKGFAVAAHPIHGFLIMRQEPPAGSVAQVRIKGLVAPDVTHIPLSRAEKVNTQLKAAMKTHPEDIAKEVATNPEVLRLIAEALKGGGDHHNTSKSSSPVPRPKKKRRA